MNAPIVIIGGGIGGLSAAIWLSAMGQPVLMLEQNNVVGGKMGEVRAAGYRWDTGPSVITMRPVFQELWSCAGRRLEDDLTLKPVEPLTRYFYRDGVTLDATRDLAAMTEQIARLDERDVEGYLSFLAYAARLHRITSPVFMYDEPPSWRSFVKANPLDMLKIDPWLTMDAAIRRRVHSRHMRQLLGRFATYVGASPYLAPATLSVIAHVELTGGVWYPAGGIHRIAEAMGCLARGLDVEIRVGCPVEQIIVEGGRAVGVRLADGNELPARAVVANVDVATTYERLLPPDPAIIRRRQQLARLEPSCSGFVLLLGVEGVHPQLAHHNIFFTDDYRREFDDIFRRGAPPHDPTIYVAITAKSDPDHAPPGCENWFVLVNTPAVGAAFDWAARGREVRDLVITTLASRFGVDIGDRIRQEVMLTPLDIARSTGAWRGALYGISSNRALNAFRRPHNRCPDVGGLYFAGGTTHPGGGVPMVTLSGKVAAAMVVEDIDRGHI
jgi:phytoene desaturase